MGAMDRFGISHVAGSVLIDVAIGECDFCAASDVGASTLTAQSTFMMNQYALYFVHGGDGGNVLEDA